jgi:hypothetical protein
MNINSEVRKPIIFIIPLIIAIVSLIMVHLSLILGWFGPDEGIGGQYCEAARRGLVKQPSNTYSNLVYMFFGLLFAWNLYKGKYVQNSNSLTRTVSMPLFFCSMVVLMGPASMAMHASESHLGQYFDLLAMYMICSLMFSNATNRLFKLNNFKFFSIFVIVLAICHYFHFWQFIIPVIGDSASVAFGFFVSTAMFMELYNKLKNSPTISFKFAVFCSLTFLLAAFIRTIGKDEHPWCNPDSLIQAHAIWHILTGVAVYFLFRYYVSENTDVQ